MTNNTTFDIQHVHLNKAAYLCVLGANVYKTHYKAQGLMSFDLHVQQWMLDAEVEGIVPYKRYIRKRRHLKKKAKNGE